MVEPSSLSDQLVMSRRHRLYQGGDAVVVLQIWVGAMIQQHTRNGGVAPTDGAE
jgi:hypothetical protein